MAMMWSCWEPPWKVRPARETLAFVKGISRANDKVAILFRTYFLWKGTTFGTLGRQLGSKGYKCILKVSTKKVVSGQTDFSDAVKKVNKTLEHIRFVNWFSSRSIRSKKLGLEYSCFQK